MAERDPLDDLIVNEEEAIDKAILKDILSHYAEIGSSGKFLPKKGFHNLTDANKMVVFLLVNKVKALKHIAGQELDRVSSKAIADETGINQKNISLYTQRLNGIVRNDNDGYFIPNYNLTRLDFLKDVSINKRKSPTTKTNKITAKKIKASPLKITKQCSITISKEQAQELKEMADSLSLDTGPNVILFISNYLRENLNTEEFNEADVDEIYRLLVSMRVNVTRINHLRQTMLNMTSKSQKLGWLERVGQNFRCSIGGQIQYNQMKD